MYILSNNAKIIAYSDDINIMCILTGSTTIGGFRLSKILKKNNHK